MRVARIIALVIAVLVTASLVAESRAASKGARLGVLLFETPATNANLPAYADGQPERIRYLAVQTVALKPDLIVALGGDMVPALKDATPTIPIVMLTSQDPVETGVVASFSRPGGNMSERWA